MQSRCESSFRVRMLGDANRFRVRYPRWVRLRREKQERTRT